MMLVYCRKMLYKNRPKEYNGIRLKYINPLDTKSLDTIFSALLCCLDLLVNERKTKHVHLYNGGNGVLLPLLKLFGKKVIISVDGIEWKRQKWGRLAKFAHKMGEWFSVKFADEIITDNKVVEDYYTEKYKVNPVTIPYGAKIIARDDSWGQILDKFNLTTKKYFIFVGRLVPEKGVHRLIKAYNKLGTDLPLIIIGDDNDTLYKKDLLKQASKKVRFLGFLYGAEYEALLANALIYVSASELEGTSPSLLAAMGAKVCSLINGIDENLQTIKGDDSYAGYYFKPNDVDDLAIIWQDLIKSPEKIFSMAIKGCDLVQKRYKWEDIAQDYIRTFEKI